MQRLTLRRPDDWHVHLRDGDVLRHVVPDTARQFARAIAMPNLKPPVTTTTSAKSYRQRILAAGSPGTRFEPLMTLYLTDTLAVSEIERAQASGVVHGVKLYPSGATTNSDLGVTKIEAVFDVLAAMERVGLPLLVHGEVVDTTIDVFDREAVYVECELTSIVERFPQLKVVLEHITTREGVQFVESASDNVAGTITPHHLLLNRNALFQGGLRPHYYCLPVLKREVHRTALVEAATSGHPKFFLGTDSAPHARREKESACGCAGVYSAHGAMELYAEAFELAGRLGNLEAFASLNGPRFYGLPLNDGTITLEKTPTKVAPSLQFGGEEVVPFRANEELTWTLRT